MFDSPYSFNYINKTLPKETGPYQNQHWLTLLEQGTVKDILYMQKSMITVYIL